MNSKRNQPDDDLLRMIDEDMRIEEEIDAELEAPDGKWCVVRLNENGFVWAIMSRHATKAAANSALYRRHPSRKVGFGRGGRDAPTRVLTGLMYDVRYDDGNLLPKEATS